MPQLFISPLLAAIRMFLLAVLFTGAAFAQGEIAVELPQPLAGWKADLERIEKAVKRAQDDDAQLISLRNEVRRISGQAAKFAEKTAAELQAVNSQLDRLGPAPKPEDPPESEAAAKLRAELTKQAADLDGAIKTVRVLNTLGRQLTEEILQHRRAQFSSQLLNRSGIPFDAALWREVGEQLPGLSHGVSLMVTEWLQLAAKPVLIALIGSLALLVWLGLGALSRRLISQYRSSDLRESPPFLRRAATAAGVSLMRAIPLVAASSLFMLGLWLTGQISGRFGEMAVSAYVCFILAVTVMALSQTILAPNQPRWRILPVSTQSARTLRWLFWGILVIWAVDYFLSELVRILFLPVLLTVALSFISTVAIATLLAAMFMTPIGGSERDGPQTPSAAYTAARVVLGILVGFVVISALTGYVALAKFLIGQIILTGSIIALALLLHVTIEQFAEAVATRRDQSPEAVAAANWYVRGGVLASLLFHILLIAAAALLILLQWGLDWSDIRNWSHKAFFGFQFGNWTISISTILIAAAIFVVGLGMTRIVQNWLEAGVLSRARFEQGARSAIRTAIGYVGATLALIVAVSYAGMDFSNLALVAGALSVGIGFGLQSVVNNFVSGLILLAERRVSVGDWVVVGGTEGHVRNISVRATEIETFDRNYVIIPNSELISGTVTNWTFRNRRARVVVEVGVGYESDPEQVESILMSCAKDHPDILELPAPRVLLNGFGDSSLDFRLVGFVGDVDKGLKVRSQLRFAILAAFRKAGVEIPFAQRDIRLREIDRLEKAIMSSGARAAKRGKASAAET
ncbi:MAG: DUF3772 domain-containing protein [Pseudomonadota bacterium]|nr:DUF3772 domain-containing protein [Pseudomonadota bacterium]